MRASTGVIGCLTCVLLVGGGALGVSPAVAARPLGIATVADTAARPVVKSATNLGSTTNDSVTDTVTVGVSPWSVAVSPDGAFAYVTNSASDTLSKIDTATSKVVATATVGSDPRGVAVSPAGNLAYVANTASNTVSRIDTATNTVLATVDVGTSPRDVTMSPDGQFVYVANSGKSISKVSTASNTVVATISIPGNPWSAVVSPDGQFVYVTDNYSSTLVKISTATNAVVDTINVGADARGLAISPDGAFAYVTHFSASNTVSKVNIATRSIAATIPVGTGPIGMAMSPDGAFAYVVNSGSATVSKIDTATATAAATIAVGVNPLGAAISPDGAAAFVTNRGSGTVSVITAATPEVAAVQVDHGTQPPTLLGDGVPGATISVRDSAGNELGSTAVNGAGKWTLQLSGIAQADNLVDIVQTVGGIASDPLRIDLSTTVNPVTFAGTDTSTAPPTISGTGTPGATVLAEDSAGNDIGQVVVGSDGSWSLPLSSFPKADRKVLVSQTVNGVMAAPATETIPVTIPAPPTPTVDWSAASPVMSGEGGIPGATVTVTDDNGTVLGTATVDEDGEWSIVLPAGVDPATGVQVVQTYIGIDSAPDAFALQDAPVINLVLGGFGLLAAVGAVGFRRRRSAVARI
jgi:YVTN family beta-propeller protein